MVLDDGERRAVVRQPAGDGAPAASSVLRLHDVGPEVSSLEVVDHREHRVGIVQRGLDIVYEARVRHPRQARDLPPGLASVLGDLHQAVVRPHINEPFDQRGFGDGHDVPEHRCRPVLAHRVDAPHPPHHLQLVAVDVARQIPRDGAPARALIVAAEENLRPEIEPLIVVRRHVDARVPVPAQRGAVGIRLGLDVQPLLAAPVEARQHPVLQLRIDDVGILGVHHGIEAIAPQRHIPVRIADAAPQSLRRPSHGIVVLRPTIDVVEGLVVGGRDLVVLGKRQVREMPPALAEIECLVQSAVVAQDQMLGVVRVEGDGVMVDMHALGRQPAPALASVVGHLHEGVHGIDAVEAMRIGVELMIVHGRGRLVARSPAPVFAHVLRAEGAALVPRRLDDGVEHVRPHGGDGEPDPPLVPGGKPAVDRPPGLAAIGGLVDARAGTPVDHRPLVPAPLPRGSVHHLRVARIEVDFVDAGVLVDLEHEFPALARVSRPVEPALAARRPQRPLRRREHGARIVGMHRDHADMQRGLESHVAERAPPVHRLVDPVPVAHRALPVVLAGAYPEGEVVPRIERDGTDGVGPVVVEDGVPGCPCVGGLPHTAGGGRDVPGAAVGRVDGDVGDAPRGHGRPDAAPAEG